MSITPSFYSWRSGAGRFLSLRHPSLDFRFVRFFSLCHSILHPLPPWHRSRILSRQHRFPVRTQEKFLPKPNSPSHLTHGLNPRSHAQLIKKRVARHCQPTLQGNAPLPIWIPVMPCPPGHLNRSGAMNDCLRGKLRRRILQSRQCRQGLESRSRRIGS